MTSEERYFIESFLFRNKVIDEKASITCESIDAFMNSRKSTVEQFDRYICPHNSIEPGSHPIPFMLIYQKEMAKKRLMFCPLAK